MNDQILKLNELINEEINRVKDHEMSEGYINLISSYLIELDDEVSEETITSNFENFNELKLDSELSQSELEEAFKAYEQVYERLLKTDLTDKFTKMSDFEILVFIKELNNQLIKLALKEEKYLDEVILLSNEINFIYNAFLEQDNKYFRDNMKFMLRPLISTIGNFDCEIENFADQIASEDVEHFLKTYLVFAKDQAESVSEIVNNLGYEKLSLDQKMEIVSEKLVEYEEFREIYAGLVEENIKERLIIFIEDFLLTDLLIGKV